MCLRESHLTSNTSRWQRQSAKPAIVTYQWWTLDLLGRTEMVRLGHARVFRGLTCLLTGWLGLDTKNDTSGNGEKVEEKPQGALRRLALFWAKAGCVGAQTCSLCHASVQVAPQVTDLLQISTPQSLHGHQLLVSYLSQRCISISMRLMRATCLELTTCERAMHYYYHNHRLPPACPTWTHYSCHASPRRGLSPSPRAISQGPVTCSLGDAFTNC